MLDSILFKLASLNIIERILGVIYTVLHANGRDVLSLCSAVTRHDYVRIRFIATPEWRGIDVENLLKKFHIPIGDRNFDVVEDENGRRVILHFLVPRRQAVWADYILRRAGVPVVTPALHKSNETAYERWEGVPVPAWADRGRGPQGLSDTMVAWARSYRRTKVPPQPWWKRAAYELFGLRL